MISVKKVDAIGIEVIDDCDTYYLQEHEADNFIKSRLDEHQEKLLSLGHEVTL